MPLIGAGVGSFLVSELAQQLNAPYYSVDAILANKMPTKSTSNTKLALEVCFPAYAVAQLSLKATLA